MTGRGAGTNPPDGRQAEELSEAEEREAERLAILGLSHLAQLDLARAVRARLAALDRRTDRRAAVARRVLALLDDPAWRARADPAGRAGEVPRAAGDGEPGPGTASAGRAGTPGGGEQGATLPAGRESPPGRDGRGSGGRGGR